MHKTYIVPPIYSGPVLKSFPSGTETFYIEKSELYSPWMTELPLQCHLPRKVRQTCKKWKKISVDYIFIWDGLAILALIVLFATLEIVALFI